MLNPLTWVLVWHAIRSADFSLGWFGMLPVGERSGKRGIASSPRGHEEREKIWFP